MMMFNIDLNIEVLELFIIKLLAIVSDDDLEKAKSTNDGFLYKLSGLGLGDLGHQLGFYPFGEVVDGYEQELSLCWDRRKGFEYVYLPLGEWPWCSYSYQLGGRLVLHGGMPLASITPLHMFNGILVYGQPILSLSKYFVGESSTTEMVTAYPFKNLPLGIIYLKGDRHFKRGNMKDLL